MDIDLTTSLAGIELKNPLIVPAGELSRDSTAIKKLLKYKPGAIVTKTIVASLLPVPLPCFASIKAGFMNNVPGSTLSADDWFSKEFRLIEEVKKSGIKIIANLAGATPEEGAKLASRAEESGVDMIEIPVYCPAIPEILDAMGVSFPVPEFSDVNPFLKVLKLVKERVSVPIAVKLSSVFHAHVERWAKALEDGGADIIVAADSIGPVLAIDIDTAQPILGGVRGYGCLTGLGLKPISLRMVFEIARMTKVPVVGVGGITSWKDAVEYILAGARAVGAYTIAHLKGPEVYPSIIDGIKNYMASKGYKSLEEFRGLTIKKVDERRIKKLQLITTPSPPRINKEKCTACGLCAKSCVYEAIAMKEYAIVDEAKCYGCGLCATICPVNAIKLEYYS
ncbi:MAG: 4Fe-4S binding protein [Halobacteria archaeon]